LDNNLHLDKTTCSKCGGHIEKGYLLGAWSWISNANQSNTRQAKKIFGFACKTCGYVEFYIKNRINSILE